ncbi:hypothetical protein [Streptomyces sp. NPDC048248]|uniref:hypothetical protein n=1 Tax=Streptomyces sp. NPDC048248 TaxID=3365523 RepID=UPI00371F0813
MTTPVDAEQAWKDLQRIRVPQERVYDEMERCASGGPGATYTTAAIMWVFLVSMGLDLPKWGVWLVLAGYVAVLLGLAVVYNRRSRMRLHRSRHTWRSLAPFLAGAVTTGGTILLSGHLVESLELPFGSLIQATASAAVFVLFTGPANRWSANTLRGAAAQRARADR